METKKIPNNINNCGLTCPLCTKKGLILITLSFFTLFFLDEKFTIIGAILLISAYIIPTLEKSSCGKCTDKCH